MLQKFTTIPLSYSIGIPFGWLLLGLFQYVICVIILGDVLLDPWYFTCAWIIEVICTLPMVIIITIINSSYLRLVSMKY